jgi:hypothetical protein
MLSSYFLKSQERRKEIMYNLSSAKYAYFLQLDCIGSLEWDIHAPDPFCIITTLCIRHTMNHIEYCGWTCITHSILYSYSV